MRGYQTDWRGNLIKSSAEFRLISANSVLIGHQKQWQFLKKAAESGRIPHGILFCGQKNLGKRKTATEFAKLLNCSSDNSAEKPCQACRNCQDIQKGSYPDLILIEPENSHREIQIGQIRDLIWKISLKPYSSSFKIAIIDNAHLMNQEAQSCFLKLLEEPKGPALLILITEYPEMLLPTILSRVQKTKFFPLKKAEIENSLFSEGIPKEKAKFLSSLALGKPGLALSFVLNPQKIEKQEKIIQDIQKLGEGNLVSRFQYAKNLFSNESENIGNNLQDLLDIWLGYLRSVFLNKIGEEIRDKGVFYNYPLLKLTKIIKDLQSINYLLSTTNVNQKLALENFLIEL